mmetsp:Transcript_7812/g.18871  ORF Transcript_7812/g.18871 Transcript_7812/m.18871 type:complete len:119 (+) Transcript_7812:4205-4561(+)
MLNVLLAGMKRMLASRCCRLKNSALGAVFFVFLHDVKAPCSSAGNNVCPVENQYYRAGKWPPPQQHTVRNQPSRGALLLQLAFRGAADTPQRAVRSRSSVCNANEGTAGSRTLAASNC